MWGIVLGWLLGRGIGASRLPDSVKQERYDRAQARRAAKRARGRATAGQQILALFVLLLVLGLLIQAYHAIFG